MSGHALLSASSASRWMACTPSARLTEGLPDTRSVYAAEGTLAHAVAELKLTKYFFKGIGPKTYKKELEVLKSTHTWEGESLWQNEMDNHTDYYVDYIKRLYLSKETKPYVALEEKLDLTAYVPEGFGTADCVMISGDTLYVIDLKYGKGVTVNAENNAQLMLYALGAYERYKLLFAIKKISMAIIQPRLDSTSEWTIEVEQLLKFGEGVKEKALMAWAGTGECVSGDHCRWCKIKATCRARADVCTSLYEEVRQKEELSNDEIGEYLEKGKLVADWLSDLQDFALSECLAGRAVKGWKAVSGRKSRVWTDSDKAFQAIIDSGVEEALLYERKPLTLAQTEKLVGKKAFEAFSEFVTYKEAKPTLVVASDKREAITNQIKAKDVFNVLN